jgi:hypothetical protein
VNVAKFFKAFPDLEDDATIAIYDLCEDQDQNVHNMLPNFMLSKMLVLILLPFVLDPDTRIQGHRVGVQGTATIGREERGCAHTVASGR